MMHALTVGAHTLYKHVSYKKFTAMNISDTAMRLTT